MIDCPFCKETRPSVEAHVIPEAMLLSVKLDDGTLREMGPMGHSKRRPIGVWDKYIWCAECERTNSSSESDAINCWRALVGRMSLSWNEPRIGTPAGLHDFVLFMLWKAAVSRQPLYEKIELGPMQEELRDALITANERAKGSFDVIFTAPYPPPRCIVQPIKLRIEGVLFAKFHLDHLDVLIKIDSRPTPKLQHALVMPRDATWLHTHSIPRSAHLDQLMHATALNRRAALRAKSKRRTR